MTLTELRYVVALAQQRHFGRAAEHCHVSQPTLSVAVKKLEDELGVQLFERRKLDVSLTPIGVSIVEQAQRVLEDVDTLKQLAVGGRDQLASPLRVGAIYTIGPYLFPHLIPALHERAPHMPLVIEENYTARLRERLRQGELDAALVALPFEEPGLVTLPLYDEPFVVVMPSSHPWTEKALIDADDLARETLLMLGSGHCFRTQILDACPACAQRIDMQSLTQTVEGTSLETIRHMVASGMGITVLPATAAGADRYAQRLVTIRRFAAPEPHRRVALTWRVSFPRPQAIEALRQAILDSGLSGIHPVNR
ncbi:MAG: LysR family transcriptional regulator [Gammaproteobacteria bacterium]|nr:LysR family transcriptional regulator [Gammaproteobacteria bacterium]